MGILKQSRPGVTTHGREPKRLYSIWFNMKARCYYSGRKQFKDYGGRGITVCDEWHDFAPFRDWAMANGYAEHLEIDREDNDGNYDSNNCRWVTHEKNQHNTRRTRLVEAFGERKRIAEWVSDPRSQVNASTIRVRIFRGWDSEKAITTPA